MPQLAAIFGTASWEKHAVVYGALLQENTPTIAKHLAADLRQLGWQNNFAVGWKEIVMKLDMQRARENLLRKRRDDEKPPGEEEKETAVDARGQPPGEAAEAGGAEDGEATQDEGSESEVSGSHGTSDGHKDEGSESEESSSSGSLSF